MTQKNLKHVKSNEADGILRDQRGLSTVEYIIILVLIAVAGIGLWSEFGEVLSEKISGATSKVNSL